LHWMAGWFMNDEVEGAWMEVVTAWFNVLSWHFPGGMEEYHEKPWPLADDPTTLLNRLFGKYMRATKSPILSNFRLRY